MSLGATLLFLLRDGSFFLSVLLLRLLLPDINRFIRLKLFVNVPCNAFNNVNNTTTVHAVIKNSRKSKNDIIFVSSIGISHAIDNALDNKFVVVLLTLLNALQGTLSKSFNRINRLISGNKRRSNKTDKKKDSSRSKNSKVAPSDTKKEKEKSNEIQTAENTSNNESDEKKNKINEMMENTNAYFHDKKNEIKDKHGLGQVEIMIHIVQALCTIYSVVSYWYTYTPDLTGKEVRVQILCRAAHLTIVPLFKPVSISM